MNLQPSAHPADTQSDIFATTRWTVVLAAGERATPQSERALEEICQSYWFPIYAYIRRRGRSKADAEDLTQEFFRRLLDGHWIERADPRKGRLRAFLVTALKHFLAKEWRRDTAQKRGGGRPHGSIDTGTGEARYATVDTPRLAAEATFDRQWALTLLELAVGRLQQEYADAGKSDQFDGMKEALVITREGLDYPVLAARFRISEGAARVAVHRFRKRFRDLYREEVAQTLPAGIPLDEEMRYLAESLASG